MKRLLTSCFGLGFLPFAPGTWGSVPAVLLFILAWNLSQSNLMTAAAMAMLVLIASIVCVCFSPAVIKTTGRKDPGEVVVDEVAGQAVFFLIIAALANTSLLVTAGAGFILFRIFDIIKPWPIRKLEKFPAGWGILADDLAAGVYAAIAFLILQKLSFLTFFLGLFETNGQMNVFFAAFLGAVQGLTEFLPVSSSGHLVLFENLFKFDPEQPQMLLFDLAVHVGTVLAILVVFRRSITAFFANLVKSKQYIKTPLLMYRESPSVHIAFLAIITTGVTGILGIAFKDYLESARGSLLTVALMWLITGTLLLITDKRKKTRIGLRQFGITAAVIVGLAQAAAIMPGISRSGATICAAILLGLHRRWSVEYSFLLAIPAIVAAALVQTIQDFELIRSAALPASVIVAGVISAFVVGIIALKLLIKLVRRSSLKLFAVYCYILAVFVFVYVLSKP
ncbi:MAG: phosphatidylglycerophosphatase A [Phycisphaerae bacterium]|nr:phosphatidylglycerophosphatase A [Phycisphaerae bacterium]